MKINNIKIIESELSSNFQKMTKQKKKKYIFKIIPNIKIAITEEQIDSINFINDIRLNHNKPKLEYYEQIDFYDFLLNEPSQFYFFPYKKSIMLSKREYLIKCTKEEIKEINKNEDITKVLLIEDLNKISTIENGNIIYILVNESYDILKENNNNINNEDESFELKDNGDFKYIKLSEEIIMDIL